LLATSPSLVQSAKRCATTVFVPAHFGRFLKQRSALFGPITQNCVDHPGLDDRVGVGSKTRVPTQVLHVSQTYRLSIDFIDTLTATKNRPPNGNFGIRYRKDSVFVCDPENNFGTMDRFSIGRTMKYGFIHTTAADRGGPLLAKNPAEGI